MENASSEDVADSTLHGAAPGYVIGEGESAFERYSDILLGLVFLVTALVSAKRMSASRQQQQQQQASGSGSGSAAAASSGGAETTVVTAFYSLILFTSVLRAAWFLIPSNAWQPAYTPIAVFAWDAQHPAWVGAALSEIVITAGSLTLFSIFILILVYWADILKKYFHPGSRRSLPMMTFLGLVGTLLALEAINVILFLAKLYSTEGMVLFNAVLLATVSMICVAEITIFSHRFRTVLKTLGAINQVSTDSQVRRIVWITVTGNLFFLTRALLEAVFAILLFVHWHRYGTVDRAFTHAWWDVYTLIKYWSEVTILALMLYILQSRFSARQQQQSGGGGASASAPDRAGYTKVPEAEQESIQTDV